VNVRCDTVQHELRRGSLLVGRDPECDLTLDDPLVSRLHARVHLDSDGVKVEDLYSTNGVYLNGERITHARLLHTGDRLFVGSHEVTFLPLSPDPARAPSVEPGSAPYHREPATRPNFVPGTLDVPITARADALDLLGSLARRLANDVKAEQAPRMLGPHLQGILRGASAGLVVPPALCEIASEYAVDLAHWTSDASWLDYVVELHLVTKRLMSAATIAGLQRSERWVGALNRRQLEYYLGNFGQAPASWDKDQRARIGTLRRLLKKK